MNTTASGIVSNLLYLDNTFGFIPNGCRDYQLNRSQPPLSSDMVIEVLSTSDLFTQETLDILDAEYDFWMTYRKSNIDGLNRYFSSTTLPRPESYREDTQLASESATPAAELYTALAAGAETGWGYSSRWFADGENLTTIATPDVIPVCLNSIMLRFELNMRYLHGKMGNTNTMRSYLVAA